MRLTDYHKSTILSGIERDLPEIDETAAIQAALVKAMSPLCRKLYKENPAALKTHYLTRSSVFIGTYSKYFVIGDAPEDTLKPFLAKRQARRDAMDKVRAAVKGCTTLKQLLDRIPEFKRYAPTEATPAKNELMVVNAVAELSKLGWPAGSKPKSEAQ